MVSPPRPTIEQALPDLPTWTANVGMAKADPESWLAAFGSVPHAILYGSLFSPTFTEHQGCLLWADFTHDSFLSWMESTGDDRRAVELVMNHRHITDFFLNVTEEPTPEQVAFLGWLLRDLWELKLRRDFPHLDIRVEFVWSDLDFSVDAQLLVYQNRG